MHFTQIICVNNSSAFALYLYTAILPSIYKLYSNMLTTEFRFGEVYDLSRVSQTGDDKVRFNRIFENANGGVVLLTFKAGQSLAEHTAPAEVMVYLLEGEIVFTMAGKSSTLKAGNFLLMGEAVPHSVEAKADSKVMLVKIKA